MSLMNSKTISRVTHLYMHLLFLLVPWLLILWRLLECKSSNSSFPSVYTVSFGFSPDRAVSISPSQETRSCFSKADKNTDKTLHDVTNTEPQCDVREEFPLQSHISCPLREKKSRAVCGYPLLNLPQRWSPYRRLRVVLAGVVIQTVKAGRALRGLFPLLLRLRGGLSNLVYRLRRGLA